mgnify:CR=1 FL=1
MSATAATAVRRSATGLALLWLLAPLLPVVLWAVSSRWSDRARLPQELGLGGWAAALDAGLLSALLRSTLLGLAVAAVATPLGAWAGRLLGWRTTRHPHLLAVALVLPVLLPPLAVAMGLDVVALRIGVPGPVAVLAVLTVLALPYTAFTAAATCQLYFHILEQFREAGEGFTRAFCVANAVGFLNRLHQLFNLVGIAALSAAPAFGICYIAVFDSLTAQLFHIVFNGLVIAVKKCVNFALRRAAGHAVLQRFLGLAHFLKCGAEHAKFCAQSDAP